MNPKTTTMRLILEAGPCYDPRERGLLPADHDLDAPITFREIIEKTSVDDAIWCFSKLPGHDSLKRHFAVDCAERVKNLMTDERSLNALVVARRHALGQATDQELIAAKHAAWAAMDAAMDAARYTVMDAAMDAARCAAWYAARCAAKAARYAAIDVAMDVAWCAEMDAARIAERAWQAERLIALTEAGEWFPV